LWKGTDAINEFVDAIEREGAAEANRLAAMGVTLAAAAGWESEALVERTYGGEGLQFTQLADRLSPDLVLVGSRGLGSAKAVLGSVSDMVVHYASRPVLVVAHPLLIAERANVIDGTLVVGWDGSAGAQAALAAATRRFPTRTVELASVTPRHRNRPDSREAANRKQVRQGATVRATTALVTQTARANGSTGPMPTHRHATARQRGTGSAAQLKLDRSRGRHQRAGPRNAAAPDGC